MSTDTPTPESVTLSDEEAWGGAHWQLFREHRPVGAYPLVGQMDGDCHACGGSWPCRPVREALAERDAARDQALREEIEKVKAERDALIALLRANSRAAEHAYPYCLRCGQGDESMTAPESLRDEVAAVLAEHGFAAGDCACGWSARPIAERFRDDWRPLREQHHTHLADALLASPALARVIREAKAEAWDEGFGDGSRQDAEGDDGPQFSNPYREED